MVAIYTDTVRNPAIFNSFDAWAYVGRASRGVAVYHEPATDEVLGEYPRLYREQIKSRR
jgi:hypothetical protein